MALESNAKWQFTKWENSVVVITGASRGVGRALAKALAAREVKLGLIARSQADLEKVVEKNTHSLILTADVGNCAEVMQAIHVVEKKLGPIDILINCAGIGSFSSFQKVDIAEIEKIMQTNFFGTVYTMKAILPSMIARKKGCIVNVASIAGRIGVPFEAAYSASKFAVIGLSEAIHGELESQGIQISTVLPGPIDTDYFSARGHPYPFRIPAPMSEEKVVNTIIATIEQKAREKFIPSWLGLAFVIKILFPVFYYKKMQKMYRSFLIQEYTAEN